MISTSFAGQNQLFVSTPFSSQKLGGDNLYFITQDIDDPKIFYGTTGKAKADGHCIKRLNLAAGDSSGKKGPIFWVLELEVTLTFGTVHLLALNSVITAKSSIRQCIHIFTPVIQL